MAITLKEENVLNQWSTMISQASGHAQELLDDVTARLEEAQIPGGCTWSVEEVKSSTWTSRVRRDFLIVQLQQFSDYRNYIGIRPYGVHLDACRFLTCEPGFFKKKLAEKLAGGDAMAISAPKNILIEQDLTAWVTVIHHCVLDAVGGLFDKLGQDKAQLRRETKGPLQIW